ncbi:MAG TPA: hypothetical protein VMS17_22365 [Gemmataceae bacterium]|nr:hypothetical protein [Gemmataceae bacterium]
MSERFAEQLSRFTPEAGKFDRDALLFAAGRASARPHRTWKIAVGALAACQLLTLAFLWPHLPPAAPPAPPSPPVAGHQSPPRSPEEHGALVANGPFLHNVEDLPSPASGGELVPDDAPVRASAIPADLVN